MTDAAPQTAPEAGQGGPSARLVHLAAQTCTKAADALSDPKLVLAWLLTSLGAPGALIGALVPVREAGALLPQIPLSRLVMARARVGPIWALGAACQGVAAAGICLAALTLSGAAAGWTIIMCLAALSVARAACSVSYKDALARTVPKGRRGRVTGLATSAAAAVALGFGAATATGVLPLTVPAIAGAVGIAGALWLAAALIFTRLPEPARAAGTPPSMSVASFLRPLRDAPQLRVFLLTRALLTGTALAPPYIVMLSAAADGSGPRLGQLGPLVIASALAAIVSGWIWGRLSDRSSRATLMASGALAASALGICAWIGPGLGAEALSPVIPGVFAPAIALFFAQIAYEGVRAGRKLHLTDMADDDARARWTALSNTIIGAVMLAGGVIGALADALGPEAALWALAVMAALSVPVASRLEHVQS